MNVKNESERKSSFIGFRVEYQDRYEIEVEAEKLDISLSDFIRRSVEHFISDLKNPIKEEVTHDSKDNGKS